MNWVKALLSSCRKGSKLGEFREPRTHTTSTRPTVHTDGTVSYYDRNTGAWNRERASEVPDDVLEEMTASQVSRNRTHTNREKVDAERKPLDVPIRLYARNRVLDSTLWLVRSELYLSYLDLDLDIEDPTALPPDATWFCSLGKKQLPAREWILVDF